MISADVLKFINIIEPTHLRTSCDDEDMDNSFRVSELDGEVYRSRCKRCSYLRIGNGNLLPKELTNYDL